MTKKMEETTSSPLMYISQPRLVQVKTKTQQSYMAKPMLHFIEKPQIPVEEKVQIENQSITVEEKKLSNETLIKSNLSGKQTKIETILEGKLKVLENNQKTGHDVPKNDLVEAQMTPFQHTEDVVKLNQNIEEAEVLISQEDEIALQKKKIITTFGLQSSFAKGRKASEIKKKHLNSIQNNFHLQREIQNTSNINQDQIDTPKQENDSSEEQLPPQEQINIQPPKPKSFKEMSVEEKIEYLLGLPAAMPKIKCEIVTEADTIQGIVVGYEQGIVKIVQMKKPYKIDVNINDIKVLNRKSF